MVHVYGLNPSGQSVPVNCDSSGNLYSQISNAQLEVNIASQSSDVNANITNAQLGVNIDSQTSDLNVNVTNGSISVSQGVSKLGNYGNLLNAGLLNAGSDSSSLDVSSMSKCGIFIKDTSTGVFDEYQLYISDDNSNWHYAESLYYTIDDGTNRHFARPDYDLSGVNYVRVRNNSITNYTGVTVSVLGA